MEGILSPQTGVSRMAEHKRYAEEFKLQAARLIVETPFLTLFEFGKNPGQEYP